MSLKLSREFSGKFSAKFLFFASLLVLTDAGVWTEAVLAQQSESDELAIIMSRHLRETKERKANAVARFGISRLKLASRTYKVGEQWTVAFQGSDDLNIALMPGLATLSAPETVDQPLHLFDFKVIEVKADGDARIKVTAQTKPGQDPVDGSVDHIVITMTPRLAVTRKEIHFRNGRPTRNVTLSHDENEAMGFSAFPIDLPDLSSTEGDPVEKAPELTPMLEKAMGNTFRARLKQSLDFRSTDIFARPIRAIWAEGAPWPAFVQTSSGTSVLVNVK